MARKKLLLTHNGETKTPQEWADTVGLHRQTIYYRLRQKRPLNQVLCSNKFFRTGRNRKLLHPLTIAEQHMLYKIITLLREHTDLTDVEIAEALCGPKE